MDSSGPSGKTSEAVEHRWANVFGTAIALLTLTIPLWIIAYYSYDGGVNAISPQSLLTQRQFLSDRL